MAKKIKYGKVEFPAGEFDEAKVSAHISIRLPLSLLKELRRLSLTEEHGGRYQVLIRDVLADYVGKQQKSRKKASA